MIYVAGENIVAGMYVTFKKEEEAWKCRVGECIRTIAYENIRKGEKCRLHCNGSTYVLIRHIEEPNLEKPWAI